MSNRSIVLIGFMGTGKSTVGARLAERLQLPFRDLDEEIVRRTGQSIPELFAERGEAYFREQEGRILSLLLEEQDPQIIATGGGAVLRDDNRKLMQERATVIHLTAEEATIVDRVRQDRNRPLLQGDVEERVRRLMAERRGLYDFAHLCVPTDGEPVEQLCARILAYMERD
ncbi:shikimate kinase [Paenibacillus dendritiformis]|uniref:shikimate kinase n=1 Tax=Paenibacillus dendritiformis TaxID=130049 RepID=UPI00143CFFD1|nr:shikimate kinase [Paenibacillus dendritiformis]NKI20702.1 shikimate kinase [Paenibacillus dendritiformis]NRF96819.1 shikimate kinase [Paenibacillus dendritiformis]